MAKKGVNSVPEHKVKTFPLPTGVYAVTIPLPMALPLILVNAERWYERRDFREHEYVHLRQIERMGCLSYVSAHVIARVKSVFNWLSGHRPHGSGWNAFMRAWWAEDQQIEIEAYLRQAEVKKEDDLDDTR